MPVMCIYRAPGVTPDDYDNVRKYLRWEEKPPRGGLAHFISFDRGVALQVDVWETLADFQAFYHEAFGPALARFGLMIAPPEILEVHGMAVAPAVEPHMLPRANVLHRTLA